MSNKLYTLQDIDSIYEKIKSFDNIQIIVDKQLLKLINYYIFYLEQTEETIYTLKDELIKVKNGLPSYLIVSDGELFNIDVCSKHIFEEINFDDVVDDGSYINKQIIKIRNMIKYINYKLNYLYDVKKKINSGI